MSTRKALHPMQRDTHLPSIEQFCCTNTNSYIAFQTPFQTCLSLPRHVLCHPLVPHLYYSHRASVHCLKDFEVGSIILVSFLHTRVYYISYPLYIYVTYWEGGDKSNQLSRPYYCRYILLIDCKAGKCFL